MRQAPFLSYIYLSGTGLLELRLLVWHKFSNHFGLQPNPMESKLKNAKMSPIYFLTQLISDGARQ